MTLCSLLIHSDGNNSYKKSFLEGLGDDFKNESVLFVQSNPSVKKSQLSFNNIVEMVVFNLRIDGLLLNSSVIKAMASVNNNETTVIKSGINGIKN